MARRLTLLGLAAAWPGLEDIAAEFDQLFTFKTAIRFGSVSRPLARFAVHIPVGLANKTGSRLCTGIGGKVLQHVFANDGRFEEHVHLVVTGALQVPNV